MKNKNWIEDWAKQYETAGKLPEKTIPCSVDGCDTKTTCFSTNLKDRVTAAEGGIRTVLSSFTCRGCRSKNKGALVQTTVQDKPVRARAAKRTNTKAAAKRTKVEELTQAAKNSTVDVNAVPMRYNFNNPAEVQQLTENTCQRPDIYLNNDRACDGCVLYEHCACTSKQLLADTGRKMSSSGPKRKK